MASRDPFQDDEDEHSDDGELIADPDPLYDPDMDQKDADWVLNRYQRHTRAAAAAAAAVSGGGSGERGGAGGGGGAGHTTDAILSCPACFQVLCYDCQQHSTYSSQFRAMFVENCEILKHRAVRPLSGPVDPSVTYWAVVCADCTTHVGVYDSEEVYHFFNILPETG